MNKEEKRERIVGLLQAVRHSNNDIQKVADEIMALKKRGQMNHLRQIEIKQKAIRN